jgi:SAM-dependent methyltransferase
MYAAVNPRLVTGELLTAVREIRDISDVLIFGCGIGGFPLSLARICPSASIVGYDIDAGKILVANERKEMAGLANLRYTSTKPTAQFDTVFALHSLHHGPESIASEMLELTRPNGVVAVVDYDLVGMKRTDFLTRFSHLSSERLELQMLGEAEAHRMHTSFGLIECQRLFENLGVRHVRSEGQMSALHTNPPTLHFYYTGQRND